MHDLIRWIKKECVDLLKRNKKIMKSFEGETLESLEGQLKYVNDALAFEGLENWEKKEYLAVKSDIEFKISVINDL